MQKRQFPSKRDIERHTRGDCHLLALALLKLLPDATPCILYSREGGSHAFVRVGKRYVDVTGFSSRKEMLDLWVASRVIPMSRKAFAKRVSKWWTWGCDKWEKASYKRQTTILAKKLVIYLGLEANMRGVNARNRSRDAIPSAT